MKIEAWSTSTDRERFLADFCGLPGRVRTGDFRKGLLEADVLERFLTLPLPFEREFWLCYEAECAVASVGANASPAYPDLGYAGFLELDLDAGYAEAGRALLATACDWLQRQGRKRAMAPIDFNTWFPYRFRTDDGDPRVFEWEPMNPPEYVRMLEDSGFEVADRYHSTCFGDLAGFLAKLEPSYHHALAEGFGFRAFWQPTVEDLKLLYRITNESYAENFLFEPIPQETFMELYVGIADKQKTGLSYFVVDPDGREVGFTFAFLEEWDEGERSLRAIILKSIAVLPGARGRGLSNALTYLAVEAGAGLAARSAVAALVRVGIQSESYAKKGEFLWRHDYALWAKAL